MPPTQNGQYDFILNHQNPSHNPLKQPSKKMLIVLGLVGIFVLILVFWLLSTLLSAAGNAQTDKMLDVAKAETELIRVSGLGVENAKDRDTINFAYTTKLSVQSAQSQSKKMLNKRGINDKKFSKLMTTTKNSKTDTQLTDAGKNNRYDETFQAIMQKQITDYQKLLKNANGGAKSSEKQTIDKSLKNTQLLLKKLKADTGSGDTSEEEETSSEE